MPILKHPRVDAQAAYCPQEVAVARGSEWPTINELSRTGPALGDRLWIVQQRNDPLVTGAALQRARELLPEATIIEAEDGPISRPDIVAAIVRGITEPSQQRLARAPTPRPSRSPPG